MQCINKLYLSGTEAGPMVLVIFVSRRSSWSLQQIAAVYQWSSAGNIKIVTPEEDINGTDV